MAEKSTTNTGKKQDKKPGTFVKGDPRINRKGRPKVFDELRTLAQSIADEVAMDAKGNPIIIDGHIATRAEIIIRDLILTNPERYLEIAYGKVKEELDVNSNGQLKVIVEYGKDDNG